MMSLPSFVATRTRLGLIRTMPTGEDEFVECVIGGMLELSFGGRYPPPPSDARTVVATSDAAALIHECERLQGENSNQRDAIENLKRQLDSECRRRQTAENALEILRQEKANCEAQLKVLRAAIAQKEQGKFPLPVRPLPLTNAPCNKLSHTMFRRNDPEGWRNFSVGTKLGSKGGVREGRGAQTISRVSTAAFRRQRDTDRRQVIAGVGGNKK